MTLKRWGRDRRASPTTVFAGFTKLEDFIACKSEVLFTDEGKALEVGASAEVVGVELGSEVEEFAVGGEELAVGVVPLSDEAECSDLGGEGSCDARVEGGEGLSFAGFEGGCAESVAGAEIEVGDDLEERLDEHAVGGLGDRDGAGGAAALPMPKNS